MLQKYIVAEVENLKKGYLFHKTNLKFDKDISSLIISDDYVDKDIEDNIYSLYSLLNNLFISGVYKSFGLAKRAAKTGVIRVELIIVYMTDINKAGIKYHYKLNECKTLNDLDKYCSAIQYVYSMKDKTITRYEIYGDPILGDDICRPISELSK